MISKERIKLLPAWCITETHPAFYDTDSKSAVGQTARLYGAMRKLQEDYNNYVNEINTTITTFINDVNADQKKFINSINKIMHDYIAMLDEKLKLQDKEIEETIVYIKENTEQALKETIMEMNENGELTDVIVNAFDNLGGRVITLENSVNNTLIPKVDTIEQNIDTIETTLNNIKATILYENNDTQGNAHEITLSQNVTNFDLIEVYGERWNQTYYAKSDTKVGRLIQFCSSRSADGSTFQHCLFEYKLNEQSITPQNSYMYNLKTQNSSQLSDIHITKVIGYKLYK